MDKFLGQLSQSIEDEVRRLPLAREPRGLYAPIEYIMEDGGKRMRPMLSMLAAEMFSGYAMRARASAMAIEVFHNFTLLHDDIMDRAQMRRSRDTVHVKWGDNTAILSGDAMMIFAYTLLGESPKFAEIFPVFSLSSIEVCEGQQLDMEFESRQKVRRDEYIEMIRLKTASLMSSALVMGAIEGGADKAQQQALHNFGQYLGLAFQIQDDLLDTYGDAATFGKNIGGDVAEGKQTFLRVTALEVASAEDRQILNSVRNFEQIKSVYDKYGVATAAQKAIEQYYAQANECLAIFDEHQVRHLKQYAEVIIKRNK